MKRRDVLRPAVAALLAVSAVGCGISNQGSPVPIAGASKGPTATTLPTDANRAVPVTLYFVSSSNRLVATQAGTLRDISAVMNHLLAGPTRQESAAGMTSAIPSGTTLLASKAIGSLATLDFSDHLASVSGQEQILAFAQIVATATSLAGINDVQVSVSGQVVNAPLPDGTLAQGPVGRADYASLLAG